MTKIKKFLPNEQTTLGIIQNQTYKMSRTQHTTHKHTSQITKCNPQEIKSTSNKTNLEFFQHIN